VIGLGAFSFSQRATKMQFELKRRFLHERSKLRRFGTAARRCIGSRSKLLTGDENLVRSDDREPRVIGQAKHWTRAPARKRSMRRGNGRQIGMSDKTSFVRR